MNKKRERLSGEERRKQIMEAALDLFAEKGFRGTRTREIATRVGISETLIFQHFLNKEELYRAVIEEFFGYHPIQPEVEDKVAAKDDWGFFHQVALHLIEHTGKDPRIIRLALYRALEESGYNDVEPSKNGGNSGFYSTLTGYIQKRVEQGAFKKIDAQLAGMLFMEALLMHVINKELRMLHPLPSVTDEETVKNLVNVFLSGLQK